jgi:hypothetical protein
MLEGDSMKREELEAALTAQKLGWNDPLILAAARERLAQLPEKCEHGQREPHRFEPFDLEGLVSECPGKQYPSTLVERIARIFYDSDAAAMAPAKPVSWEFVLQDPDRSPWHKAAVAVLDALNQLSAHELAPKRDRSDWHDVNCPCHALNGETE